MVLGNERFKGLRKLADGQAPTVRADWSDLVDDLGKAVFDHGTALPTATDEKWPGRTFWHDTENRYYVCTDELAWVPLALDRWTPASPLGADGGNFAKPPVGSALITKTGEVKVRLNADGRYIVNFETPFPNRCLHITGTTIEGLSTNPTINARSLSATQADLIWANGANELIAFTYVAFGY